MDYSGYVISRYWMTWKLVRKIYRLEETKVDWPDRNYTGHRPVVTSNPARWCITTSLSYKNTMINRIIMETVACLRSKCHLKQNLIPSWPWSFWHTSCISDFWCKTKYTNKNFCRTPRPAYLAVLPVLVIFCLLGPTNFKKSGT